MDDVRLDELRRYWDEIARGGQATAGALDAGLAVSIRRLHTLDDVPPPDPVYVRRLRESLMDTTAMPLPLADPVASPGLDSGSMQPAQRARLPLPVSHGRWALAQLATAALLLLTLVGSFLAFGPGRQELQHDAPALIPAISGTPATPETAITETLLDTTVAALPEGSPRVAVDRWRLQPSPSAVTLPAHEGAVMITVDSGEITVTADGTEYRLAPRDALDVTNEEFAFRASGSAEAIAYVVYVTPEFSTKAGQSVSRIWQSGDPLVHAMDFVLSSSADDFAGGSARLVLEELTLPPGSVLPPREASPLVWTEVGAGTLGLTLEGERLPYRWKPGTERKFFQFGREPLPFLASGTTMMMRNAGDDPLVLYRLTLTPSVETSGDAKSDATPRPP